MTHHLSGRFAIFVIYYLGNKCLNKYNLPACCSVCGLSWHKWTMAFEGRGERGGPSGEEGMGRQGACHEGVCYIIVYYSITIGYHIMH